MAIKEVNLSNETRGIYPGSIPTTAASLSRGSSSAPASVSSDGDSWQNHGHYGYDLQGHYTWIADDEKGIQPDGAHVLGTQDGDYSNLVSDVGSGVAGILGTSETSSASGAGMPTGGSQIVNDGGIGVTPNPYTYADISRIYGMDATTAYQEALSNTSYTRAVQDLQRAGLNPILAVQQGGASSAVYQATPEGVQTGVSSAEGAHNMYKALSNMGTLIGSLAGLKSGIFGAAKGALVGRSVGGAIGNLIDNL